MKKFTFLIALLLSAMWVSYGQQSFAYSRTVLTGQTYTQIAGGTVINTDAGLTAGFMTGNQDDGAALITLPFTFKYAGVNYTQVTFVTNGWIGLGNQGTVSAADSRAPGNLFTSTVPNNLMAPWFGDLGANFPTGNGSMVHGTVGTDVYAFEWRNSVSNGFSQNTNTNVMNYMVKIYGPASATPGRIEFLYGSTIGSVTTARAIGLEGVNSGLGNFLNAVNGSTGLTTTAAAWPGAGNGYRFDPAPDTCNGLPVGGIISGPAKLAACATVAPGVLYTEGATMPQIGITYAWQQSVDGGTTWVAAVGGTNAATPHYSPPAYAGTPIKYRLQVTCAGSGQSGYSTIVDFAGPSSPGLQASGLVATPSYTNVVANWVNGSGGRRVVVVSTSPIVDPVDATSPALTASTVFANTGQQIIYDGTGSTVTMTGVTCGTTYYMKVYEVLRCGTGPYNYYYNTAASTNAATVAVPSLIAPATQASALSIVNNVGGFTASWTAGTGARRLVLVSTTPITDPVNGSGPALTAATAIAGPNQQIVYDGTGTSVTVTGISCTAGGTYYIKVLEYDRCSTTAPFTYAYNTTSGSNAVTFVKEGFVAPVTQASNLTVTSGIGSLVANWTNGSGTRRMVIVSDAPINDPANATGIAAIAGTAAYTGSGQQVVYDGTGTTVTVTGILCETGIYYVKVLEYNRCGATGAFDYVYNTLSATNAVTYNHPGTLAPTTQATALTVTNGLGSFTASWTIGNGLRRMVYVSDTPIANPVDESGIAAPAANAVYGGGGEQMVYDGTGTTVTVTGVPCGLGTYYVKVFEYNRCGATGNFTYTYNTTTGTNEVTNNVPEVPAPATQASALTLSPVITSTVATWVNGNGSGRMVYISDSPIVNPLNESGIAALTGTAAYAGSGQQLAYIGTGTTVTITGLSCGTTYYVKVYSYNVCGPTGDLTYVYNTTTGTNAASTTGLPVVALPQTNNFTGFTGSNLATVVPNWYEAAIVTAAGSTPAVTNPAGSTSLWTSSAVFGSTTTAKINLLGNTRNEWIISPKMTIAAASRLKFKAAITDAASAAADIDGMVPTDDVVNVMISTDGCGATWTPLYTFDANSTTSLTNVLTDYSLDIAGTYIGQTVQIAFQAYDGPSDDTPSYDFHVGNIVIELTPLCDAPVTSATPVTLITENGATIAWAAPLTGTPTGYQYVVATTNVAPTGAGTAIGTTGILLNTLPSSTMHYVFVRAVCGASFSNWIMAASFRTLCDAPEVLTTTPGSRCGTGSVALSATATAGSTLNWYAAETGGNALATGASFNPTVSATTTYYVGASTGASIGSSGKTAPAANATTYTDLGSGVVFTVVDGVTLVSTDVYSTTAGTMKIGIRKSDGTLLFETPAVAIAAGGTTTPTVVPLNFFVPAGDYRIVSTETTGVNLVRDSGTAVFPYNGTDGKVSVTTGYLSPSPATTTYYWFYNIQYSTGCNSARTAVTATVSPAVAIAAQASNPQICAGGSTTLTATSTNANYTYVWTPGNLTGPSQTLSPTATTTYTVTATDAGTNCATTQTVLVTVNALPPAIVVTPSAPAACADQVVALTATGGGTIVSVPYCIPTFPTYPGATGDFITNFEFAGIVNNGTGDAASDYTYYNNLTANVVAGQTYPVNLVTGGTAGLTAQQFGVWIDYNQSGTFEANEFVFATTTSTLGPIVVTGNITIPATAINGVTRLRVASRFSSSVTAAASCTQLSTWGEYEDYNVAITGATNPPGFLWTPSAGLYTDAAATVPYTGTSVTTVYTKVNATATYTANVTNGAGCANHTDVTVTLKGANTPTGATSQTITAATAADATIEDIVVTETGVIWYASLANAIAGVSPLAAGTQVFANTTYYGTLTAGSCSPLPVTITQVLGGKGFDISSFSYYPNPVKEVLNLSYSSDITSVAVYNLLGQKVIAKEVNAAEAKIDMSQLADGTYIVNVSAGDSVKTFKVIKKQ